MPCETDVSVVIITYNRSGMLLRTLESLGALHTDGNWTFDVVVVDNDSTDDTSQVIAEKARNARIPIRPAHESRQGVPQARNRGIAEASGKWIAFIDDDELAAPVWLAELLSFAQANGVLWVGGAVHVVLDEPGYPEAPLMYQELLGGKRFGSRPCRFYRKRLPATSNILIHRTVFERFGLFNETMTSGGSDHDFFWRLVTAGLEGWYVPGALVYHLTPPYRTSEKYLRWKFLRYGKSRAECDRQGMSRLKWWLTVAARCGQAMIQHVPIMVWGSLLRKQDVRLKSRCLIWRFEGYLRYALRHMAPRLFAQQEFFTYLEFRSEREQVEHLQHEKSRHRRPMPDEAANR
jgi:glycosyltransferase involved in cell wall biosynthesis